MALKLDILANTSKFVSEMKKAGASAEDITDALNEVSRQGDADLEKVEASLKDVAKVAKKTGDDTGKALKGGFDEAKSEAASSGKEAAASFSGGFEDVADFVQETLANALGGFGPLGAAAGTALAVGLGAALSSLAAEQERIDAIRESARDLSEELYENKGALPIGTEISKAFELLTKERAARGFETFVDQWADLGTNMDELKDSAQLAKVPVGDLIRALSGSDLPTAKRQLEAVEKAWDALNKKSQGPEAWGLNKAKMVGQMDALEGTRKQLQDQVDLLELVAESNQEVTDTYGESGEAAAAATEAAKAKVDELSAAWQDAATDAATYWTTNEEGQSGFDWGAYLADAEATLAASNEFKRQIVGLPPEIATEAQSVFAAQGAQAGVAYITAFTTNTTENQARMSTVAKANGEAAGTAAAEGIVSGFGSPDLTATPDVETQPAKDLFHSMLDHFDKAKQPVTTVKAQTSEADMAMLASKQRASAPVTFPVYADMSAATTAIRNYHPPTVYIPGVVVKPGTRQPI